MSSRLTHIGTGEMVVSVFFKSSGTVGLNLCVFDNGSQNLSTHLNRFRESGRALLGLMIAFNLNWMYFGSQACKHFVHAIRRHWMTGFMFTALHLPLCMSLLLASSAINRLITSASVESELGGGLKWFFGAGLGASVWTMATLGVLHKNLDDDAGLIERSPGKNRRTISRRLVLGTRYLAGLAMILIPLVKDMSSVKFLAVYVGITAFLILEETISRIERRDIELDRRESKEEVV
jgi:low temperature requirement protein LtrA